MDGNRTYTEQEAEDILRAATRQSGGSVSRDRLLQMAEELGISIESLSQAEYQVKTQGAELRDRKEFEGQKRASFLTHLGTYLTVNIGLLLLNVVTSGHISWALFPMLGWGIGLGAHFVSTIIHGADFEREFERWRAAKYGYRSLISSESKEPSGIPATIQNRSEIHQRIKTMALRDRLGKLEAIKQLREETGISLKEAKDSVEAFQRENPGIIT